MAQVLIRNRLTPILARPGVLHSPSTPRSAAFPRSLSSVSAEHDDIGETLKWRKITVVAYMVCGALTLYNFVGGGHHEHQERTEYPYLRIRNKEYPWGPNGLLEFKHDH